MVRDILSYPPVKAAVVVDRLPLPVAIRQAARFRHPPSVLNTDLLHWWWCKLFEECFYCCCAKFYSCWCSCYMIGSDGCKAVISVDFNSFIVYVCYWSANIH